LLLLLPLVSYLFLTIQLKKNETAILGQIIKVFVLISSYEAPNEKDNKANDVAVVAKSFLEDYQLNISNERIRAKLRGDYLNIITF
jgi:DNA-binding ferritin-like protein (Dps family)